MKKKHISYLLLFSLLLIPAIVFAGEGEDLSSMGLLEALGMHLFLSFHAGAFGCLPLSMIFEKAGKKKTFWKIFLVRVIVILVLVFISPGLSMAADIIFIFGGGFILFPFAGIFGNMFSKKQQGLIANVPKTIPKPTVILKCTKCDAVVKVEHKFCENCGAALEGDNIKVEEGEPIPKDNSPIVKFDATYLKEENEILKEIVIEQIKAGGDDAKKLSTGSLNFKRTILNILLFIASFFAMVVFFFNLPITTSLVIEVIAILIYLFINSKLNVINVITKQAKKNPDTEISQIILDIKSKQSNILIPNFVKTIIVLVASIIIPCIIFATPKVLYMEYGEGYEVLRYTRGFITEEELVIPKEYKGKPVIAIEENAFINSTIKKVTLPETLEVIKTKAFYNANQLKEITIPSKVTEIRASAFEDCTRLVTVNLPEGLETIRASAFANNYNLRHIKLPDSLTYLGASAFENCERLEEITIPKGVIEINGATFKGCTLLEKITLHDEITSIHGEAFMNCQSLLNITLPPKITEIRGDTFNGCHSLQGITIPEGVTRIGGSAFRYNYDLAYAIVPSTVTEIGSSAFRECSSLATIRIPANAYVNERAFKDSPTIIYEY